MTNEEIQLYTIKGIISALDEPQRKAIEDIHSEIKSLSIKYDKDLFQIAVGLIGIELQNEKFF